MENSFGGEVENIYSPICREKICNFSLVDKLNGSHKSRVTFSLNPCFLDSELR